MKTYKNINDTVLEI